MFEQGLGFVHHRGMSRIPALPPRWAAALALLLCLLAAMALTTAHAQTQTLPSTSSADVLPSLGDAGDMTPLAERQLGDLIVRDLFRDPTFMDDPIISEYADGIWRRLLAGAQQRGTLTPELAGRYAWRILLMRDREVNAFAMPGGYMGLNLGLIGIVDSRDELAAVLAHEMSHIMQRHIARMIGRQNREQPLMLAAMAAAILAGIHNPEVGVAALAGGQAAAISRELSFSRDMEREADRVGYSVFVQAGFNPWGFVSMFEKFQAASRINDNGDWPFLRDHPLTTERIADMQERVHQLQQQPKPAPDWEALLIAARARVLARPGVDMLRMWAHAPEATDFASLPPPKRAAVLYAAALSYAQLDDPAKAQALAAQLSTLVTGNAQAVHQARLLQADLALRAGQPERALQWLTNSHATDATQLSPHTANTTTTATTAHAANQPKAAGTTRIELGSASDLDSNAQAERNNPTDPIHFSLAGRAERLLRATAQIKTGQSASIKIAAASLQAWVSDHPQDALAWQTLAQADQALGYALRALRADGEAQMANLDYAAAIDRWRAAQDYARQHQITADDLIEASIVEVRLKAARDAQKRQKEEEKKWG